MTISIAHVNLSRDYRGGERQTELLIRELAQTDIRQVLVARRHGILAERVRSAGVEVREVAASRIATLQATADVDLVHVHEGRSVYAAYLRSLLSRTPYVVTRRVDNPIGDHWLAHKAYRRAAVVVSVANAVDEMVSLYDSTIQRRVIYSASSGLKVDEARSTEIRNSVAGKLLVGHVGALDARQKGQDVIIQVARELEETHPDIHFMLVGGGDDEVLLREQARGLENLSFAGFVDNVGDYLSAFDLFVLPSHKEGIGSILFDAMAQSLPIVASRAGGVPEIVHDGRNGILIDRAHPEQLKAAILRLHADPALRRELGENGKQIARQYTPGAMADSYLDLYRAVIDGKRLEQPPSTASSEPIKVLCVTEGGDRPTVATFIGLRRAGVDLSVVCPRSKENYDILSDAGVPVIDIPFRKRFDTAATRRLRDELQRRRYDILHVFNNKALQNGLVASRGLNNKIVAYRGIVGNVSFFDPISWRRFLNPRIDLIICVADAIRDFFLQMRPAFLRIPEERLVTIYKGHSLDWYTDEPADLTEINIPKEAFVVGCVANIRPRKGIEYLVDAMADLPEEWQVHLVLVGDMDAKSLDRRIAASPAVKRIHRTGVRKDAPAVAAACDVFVLPSLRREGLARSLIEAMAYGVAPIVTDCGGSPELVIDGVSGLVVPVRDSHSINKAIRRLFENPELRERLGRAARRRIAEDFRIEDTIEKTLAEYHRLTSRSA
jgi:glycosyltransferase involved in cell wall biosynthesis